MNNESGRAIVNYADIVARPLPNVVITEVGMIVDGPLPFDDWSEVGPGIEKGHRAFSLAAGDWLVYGEKHYPDRYEQAMDATGLSIGRLRNLASTCGRVPHSVRQLAPSISHMESVASFTVEYQAKFLDLAKEYEIDRDSFRTLMQQVRDGEDPNLLTIESGQIIVLPPKITKDDIIDRAKSVVWAWQQVAHQDVDGQLQNALTRLEEILGDD